jgi:hypothetical protein
MAQPLTAHAELFLSAELGPSEEGCGGPPQNGWSAAEARGRMAELKMAPFSGGLRCGRRLASAPRAHGLETEGLRET